MQELISIIIPVYNEKKYIVDCLNSILSQTYQNLEIIIVDDGSDIETAAICDNYTSIDNRVSVVHKKNEGLSSARITGLNIANGSWVFFSDHDDVLSPVAIESLARFIDVDVDIISGKRNDFAYDAVIQSSVTMSENYIVLKGDEAIEKIPIDNQETIITPLWGKIYRREFLQNIVLLKYKEQCPVIFFEDVLMTQIIFHYARKIVFVNDVLYYHREVPTSISRSGKISEFYIDQINSGDILLEFVREKGLLNYYNYQIDVYIKSIIRIWCLISIDDKNREGKIKNQIRKYFKKYYKEYVSINGIGKKILAYMFLLCPQIVKQGVKAFIFTKNWINLRNA